MADDESTVISLCEQNNIVIDALENTGEEITVLVFHDIRWGTLPICRDMEKAGIPYDSKYASGTVFSAGIDYCRYSANGDLIVRVIEDSAVNPPIQELMRLLEEPEKLRKYIQTHHDLYTVPPLDKAQAHNKKLWRMRLLVDPSLYP